MFEVTESAVEQLKAFQQSENKDMPVRISVMSGSSSSPNLGVVCDEQADTDLVYTFDNLIVILDKGLLEYCQKISVDYVQVDAAGCSIDGGFKIKPEVSL